MYSKMWVKSRARVSIDYRELRMHAFSVQSYEKSRGERNKFIYFLFRDGVTSLRSSKVTTFLSFAEMTHVV